MTFIKKDSEFQETNEDFARAKAQTDLYALLYTQSQKTIFELITHELDPKYYDTFHKHQIEFAMNYIDEGKIKKSLEGE